MKALPKSILRRPVVTEKTTALKESRNQVVFEVNREATKLMIKEAIETAYKVRVESVNTMIVRGKIKRMGKYAGRRPAWKKAIATLHTGDKIELFEGGV